METTIESILKEAYFLELRGKALYQEALRDDMNPDLRDLFTFFAKEEETHSNLLKDQMKNLRMGKPFLMPAEMAEPGEMSFATHKIAAEIRAAGYEGALVGAALDFERRAYEFYRDQAEKETEPGAKALFTELSRWEKQHMMLFAELDREIREKVWYDNNFWPLD